MDSGSIHRIALPGGALSTSFDPYPAADPADIMPPLGARTIGLAYHPLENRVYYTTWADDFVNNGNPNEIRSVALDASGDFVPASDRNEFSLTTDMPAGDIEFNSTYTRLLVAEIGYDSSPTDPMNPGYARHRNPIGAT